MADPSTAVRAILAADGDTTGSLGAATAIYYETLPQNPSLPAITITEVDRESTRHHGGESGLARSTVQVDVHATTHTQRKNTTEFVRLALSRYTGAIGGVTVREIFMDGGRHFHNEPFDGSQQRQFNERRDYVVWYIEAVPS